MANADHTANWAHQVAPQRNDILALAEFVRQHLPRKLRERTSATRIEVEDYPSDEVFDDLGLETPFDLLGLFEGAGDAGLWTPNAAHKHNRLTLFRRAILDYWAENEETLEEIVSHIVINELGQHFGLSENEIEAIETQIPEYAAPSALRR